MVSALIRLTHTTAAAISAIGRHLEPRTRVPFALTHDVLLDTVCADLDLCPQTEAEFTRRARELALLLTVSGATVEIEPIGGRRLLRRGDNRTEEPTCNGGTLAPSGVPSAA